MLLIEGESIVLSMVELSCLGGASFPIAGSTPGSLIHTPLLCSPNLNGEGIFSFQWLDIAMYLK